MIERKVKKEKVLKIYRTGTNVILSLANIPGIITEVKIQDLSIKYEVTYFCSGQYIKQLFIRSEFIVDKANKKKQIGFIYG